MTTRIRTWILLAGLSGLFISLGALVGGASGILLFAGIAIAFNFAMYWFSDRLALKASRARPLEEGESPELHALTRELAELANVPVPRLYSIPSEYEHRSTEYEYEYEKEYWASRGFVGPIRPKGISGTTAAVSRAAPRFPRKSS